MTFRSLFKSSEKAVVGGVHPALCKKILLTVYLISDLSKRLIAVFLCHVVY